MGRFLIFVDTYKQIIIFLLSFVQLLWNRLTPSGYISMIGIENKNALIHYSKCYGKKYMNCYMYQSQIAEC